MAKQAIDRGTVANDGTGDNLRDGTSKINDNFDEIYTLLGDGTFQVPTTDYSVSGTTSTFTSPPAGSAVIVIKEF